MDEVGTINSKVLPRRGKVVKTDRVLRGQRIKKKTI